MVFCSLLCNFGVTKDMIKLSQWAKKQGVTYKTAWKWVKSGKMPENIKVHTMPTGTILIEEV